MENNNIPRILPAEIEALKARVEYRFMRVDDTTNTLCVALLDSKFKLAIGTSGCIDARLFDQEKGEQIAKADAERQVTQKLWEMEGYRLYMRLCEEPGQIAMVAHEVNRAYCESMGDASQPAWADAPEWQKSSARLGVALHLNGDHGPNASHASWYAQKLADGWKYGPVKDVDAKTHPCMRPFHELSKEQQAKDYLFRGVVHAFKRKEA